MPELGSIWVNLGLKADDFKKGLADATSQLQKFGDTANKSFGSSIATTISNNWKQIAVGIGVAGAAIEKVARDQEALTLSTEKLARAYQMSSADMRNFVADVAGANDSVKEILYLMGEGKKQGVTSAEGLKTFAEFWDSISHATGANSEELAAYGNSLKAFGIEADNISDSMNSLGFIASKTNIPLLDFLSTMGRTAEDAGKAGISLEEYTIAVESLWSKGVKGRTMAATLNQGFQEMATTGKTLQEVFGVTDEKYTELMDKISGSGNGLQIAAQRFDELRTPLQKLQTLFENTTYRFGEFLPMLSQFSMIMMGIGAIGGASWIRDLLPAVAGTTLGLQAAGTAAAVTAAEFTALEVGSAGAMAAMVGIEGAAVSTAIGMESVEIGSAGALAALAGVEGAALAAGEGMVGAEVATVGLGASLVALGPILIVAGLAVAAFAAAWFTNFGDIQGATKEFTDSMVAGFGRVSETVTSESQKIGDAFKKGAKDIKDSTKDVKESTDVWKDFFKLVSESGQMAVNFQVAGATESIKGISAALQALGENQKYLQLVNPMGGWITAFSGLTDAVNAATPSLEKINMLLGLTNQYLTGTQFDVYWQNQVKYNKQAYQDLTDFAKAATDKSIISIEPVDMSFSVLTGSATYTAQAIDTLGNSASNAAGEISSAFGSALKSYQQGVAEKQQNAADLSRATPQQLNQVYNQQPEGSLLRTQILNELNKRNLLTDAQKKEFTEQPQQMSDGSWVRYNQSKGVWETSAEPSKIIPAPSNTMTSYASDASSIADREKALKDKGFTITGYGSKGEIYYSGGGGSGGEGGQITYTSGYDARFGSTPAIAGTPALQSSYDEKTVNGVTYIKTENGQGGYEWFPKADQIRAIGGGFAESGQTTADRAWMGAKTEEEFKAMQESETGGALTDFGAAATETATTVTEAAQTMAEDGSKNAEEMQETVTSHIETMSKDTSESTANMASDVTATVDSGWTEIVSIASDGSQQLIKIFTGLFDAINGGCSGCADAANILANALNPWGSGVNPNTIINPKVPIDYGYAPGVIPGSLPAGGGYPTGIVDPNNIIGPSVNAPLTINNPVFNQPADVSNVIQEWQIGQDAAMKRAGYY
jgi:hypothetical protein